MSCCPAPSQPSSASTAGSASGPSSSSAAPRPSAAGCCGGPAKAAAGACCLKDESARAAGLPGCGCGNTAAAAAPPEDLPVAILGAGPVGLAAAAHLAERGLAFVILEAGSRVGAHLQDYGHVPLFSPWRYNIDAAMARQLQAEGWIRPPDDGLPLARDVVNRVLQPFSLRPAVARALRLDTRVTAISREGLDKAKTQGRAGAAFVVKGVGGDGTQQALRARAVIDATGTWGQANPLGAGPGHAAPESDGLLPSGVFARRGQ